jgi:hypothetical protein
MRTLCAVATLFMLLTLSLEGNNLPVADVAMDSEGIVDLNADKNVIGPAEGSDLVEASSVTHKEISEGAIPDSQEGVHSASTEANRTDPSVTTVVSDWKECETPSKAASVPDYDVVAITHIQKHADGIATAENSLDSLQSPFPAHSPHVTLSEDQTADVIGSLGSQIKGAPLQAASSIATLPDTDAQDCVVSPLSEDGCATVVNGAADGLDTDEGYNHMPSASDLELIVSEHHHEHGHEHLPEPPASPTSNTFLSTSSTSTYGEHNQPPVRAGEKGGRIPTANRLSISYAGGSRRLVIDADVVSKLKVFRSEGRIEVNLNVEKEDESSLKGIYVRGLCCTRFQSTKLTLFRWKVSLRQRNPTYYLKHTPLRIWIQQSPRFQKQLLHCL